MHSGQGSAFLGPGMLSAILLGPGTAFKYVTITPANNISVQGADLSATYQCYGVSVKESTTYQYGVPMKESLFCRTLAFFADTPKSAVNITNVQEFQIKKTRQEHHK